MEDRKRTEGNICRRVMFKYEVCPFLSAAMKRTEEVGRGGDGRGGRIRAKDVRRREDVSRSEEVQ